MGSSLSRLKNRLFTSEPGAAWSLRDGGAMSLASSADVDVLLVPAEDVLTLLVPLPLPTHRKRSEALPFAIEDRIASPIDMVHLALARNAGETGYLACAVDPALLRGWIETAEMSGLPHAAIMPDALALPRPVEGHWTVLRQDGTRILVRMADGRGFAAAETNFVALWAAAGKPVCDELRAFPLHIPVAIDLRQGDHAVAGDSLAKPLRRAAAVAAIGLLAHGAIATADTILIKSIAAREGVELQARLARVAPGAYRGNSPEEAAEIAAQMLPAGPAAGPATFTPTLARVSQALAPYRNRLAFRSIGFAEDGRRMRVDFDAPDTATLESARKALAGAGFVVQRDGTGLTIDGQGARP